MNRIKVFALLTFLACVGSVKIYGQVVEIPYDCASSGMILTQGNSLSGSQARTVFYHVNTATNPFTFDTLFVVPYNLNSTAYNSLDNYLYAFPAGVTTPMLRIDAVGNVTEFSVKATPTAPGGGGYKGGSIDTTGIYYLSSNNNDNRLFYIDLKAYSATSPNYTTTAIPLSGGGASGQINLPDIAWNPVDGKFYGVDNGAANQTDKLTIITLNGFSSGTVTRVGTYHASASGFGAMYIGTNKSLYGSLNSGGFYQFNDATGDRVKIADSPPSTTNDGSNCPLEPITFKTDIQVTKTDGIISVIPGHTTTYTIVVSNAGPFGAMNIQVVDSLPIGIPVANVSYSAITSANASTTISGTKTIGAMSSTMIFSDLIALEVGASVTYTVTVTVPVNYASTTLVNTATATPNRFSTTDLNPANNRATDIDEVKTPFILINPHVRGNL